MGGVPDFLRKLVSGLSEKNYEQTLFDYRFWMKLGAEHGLISQGQLYNDIRARINPDLVYPSSKQLIHPTGRLLLRFVTDVGLDPALSTYASDAHDRLCRSSFEGFVTDNLDFMSGSRVTDSDFCRFYTNANFLAHCINLGHLSREDVRDRILQSLTFRPTIQPHQFNSLIILLKISGSTFAAYAAPLVLDRCYDVLKTRNARSTSAVTELAKVRAPILTMKEIMDARDCRRF